MPLLELKNIKKSFDSNIILKDLSLSVEKGEVIVILGPSGCGKSTLLRCINGLETIQDGEILLDGEVISNRKKDMHLIRQKRTCTLSVRKSEWFSRVMICSLI